MSDRHDLRRQIREIREALSRFPPEQLVDICTHIFRQYVMDGAAPAPATMQTQDELAGLSFAQVIERLQLRLDLPELRQFEIHGGRVGVKVDGRVVAIDSPDGRAEALPAMPGMRRPQIQQVQVNLQPAAPSPQPAPASPGTESRETVGAAPPGVAPVGHSGSARPDGTARPAPARPAATATAVTPAARPMASPAASAGPAAAAAAGRPAAAPSPAPAKPAPPEKPEASPGGRFNLLEID